MSKKANPALIGGFVVAAVALLVAPIAAAMFAWLILGEALTALQLAAIAVVLAGIYGAWQASFAVLHPGGKSCDSVHGSGEPSITRNSRS